MELLKLVRDSEKIEIWYAIITNFNAHRELIPGSRLGLPTLDLGIPGRPPLPSRPFLSPPLPAFPLPSLLPVPRRPYP